MAAAFIMHRCCIHIAHLPPISAMPQLWKLCVLNPPDAVLPAYQMYLVTSMVLQGCAECGERCDVAFRCQWHQQQLGAFARHPTTQQQEQDVHHCCYSRHSTACMALYLAHCLTIGQVSQVHELAPARLLQIPAVSALSLRQPQGINDGTNVIQSFSQ
jgi:hypothetical protein